MSTNEVVYFDLPQSCLNLALSAAGKQGENKSLVSPSCSTTTTSVDRCAMHDSLYANGPVCISDCQCVLRQRLYAVFACSMTAINICSWHSSASTTATVGRKEGRYNQCYYPVAKNCVIYGLTGYLGLMAIYFIPHAFCIWREAKE